MCKIIIQSEQQFQIWSFERNSYINKVILQGFLSEHTFKKPGKRETNRKLQNVSRPTVPGDKYLPSTQSSFP